MSLGKFKEKILGQKNANWKMASKNEKILWHLESIQSAEHNTASHQSIAMFSAVLTMQLSFNLNKVVTFGRDLKLIKLLPHLSV